MFAIPRRTLSAVVLLLQLMLGTRGLMTVGDIGADGLPATHTQTISAGTTSSAEHPTSAHAHHQAPSEDSAVSEEPVPAGEHEHHGPVGCHSGAPCCAPVVPHADERDVRATVVHDASALSTTDTPDVAVSRDIRRQPPATAPPSRF